MLIIGGKGKELGHKTIYILSTVQFLNDVHKQNHQDIDVKGSY